LPPFARGLPWSGFFAENALFHVFGGSGAIAGLYGDFEELKLWAFLTRK
jgi:hypothetical protein